MGELATLHFKTSTVERPYTGVELRPHFLLSELMLRGSGVGVFVGPCRVQTEHLVDWEDRLARDRIEARKMIHFIGEFFGMTLNEGVLTQRFFMATMMDVLNEMLRDLGKPGELYRTGDDLWLGADPETRRKLSVSIVTATPVSALMHVGINIDPAGAPVPALGIAELGLKPEQVISRFEERFSKEWADMKWACTKVRPMV
jgi:hypothetical protein